MALKSTGYQAAIASVTWAAGQDLDSLTDGEWTDLSDEINNSTTKYTMVDFRLVLGSAAFTGTDSAIALYIVRSVDGTNYPDWTGNVTTDEQQNEQYFDGVFTTTGATEAQDIVLRDIPIPPGKYKIGIRSLANVTLAATGNSLEWRPHSFEDA